MGRKTASVLIQALISQLWPSPLDSAAKRSRLMRVLSSLTRASSSRRSLGARPSGRPALRMSSWRCLSRFCSRAEAVFAVNVGAEMAGADLIQATGRRAKPDEV